jgi:mannose-1-phosphate guanylyltransferase
LPAKDDGWAIVLAGGDGARLRPLVREVFGDDRPKQYAPLVGVESLLRQTLNRVGLLFPPHRSVIVSREQHSAYVTAEAAASGSAVLLQPENRGTAMGVLFPAHWIYWRDPEATVAVFPSDHFILEETLFMAHVVEVMAFVDRHPEWLVLLGAQASEPETEYGWIEPGETLEWTAGGPICRANRFREKPKVEAARAFLARGWLWNTFVFVAKVSALIEAGRRFVPEVHRLLAATAAFVGTRREIWAIQQAYAKAPVHNFSRSVLQAGLLPLAVSKVPPVTWFDLGTPSRLFKLLRTLGMSPAWMRGQKATGAMGA